MSPLSRRTLLRLGLLSASGAVVGAALGCRPGRSEADTASATGGLPERTPAPATGRPLRLALSAAFVSEAGVAVYDHLARYLTHKTGLPLEFISGLAYGTINSMLEAGALDFGFICGLPYVLLHDRPQPAARLLAAPVMKAARYQGQPKYYSDLIVRKDSPYQTLQELQGRTYVYNDELSNSGYNMPRYRLLQLGLTKGFFGKVVRSGSHEESIRRVAAGEADASFVDSLVLDHDREKGLGQAHAVRVLESVGPAGICPLVASARLPTEVVQVFQRELLRMHEDAEGRKLLQEALLDRFTAVEDSNYDDIRAMKAAAERAGVTVIR